MTFNLLLGLVLLLGISDSFTYKNVRNQAGNFILKFSKKNYHFSQRYTDELIKRLKKNNFTNYYNNFENDKIGNNYEFLLKRLNSKNITEQNNSILGNDDVFMNNNVINNNNNNNETYEVPRVKIIINRNPSSFLSGLGIQFNPTDGEDRDNNDSY